MHSYYIARTQPKNIVCGGAMSNPLSVRMKRLVQMGIVLLVMAVVSACSDNEPQHAGRYLHEWAGDIEDANGDVRLAAVKAIGQIGPEAKSAAGAIMETLKDEEDEIRAAAVVAIGCIGKGAIPDLISGMQHKNPLVRDESAKVLAKTGKPAFPHVIELLEHEDA